LSRDETNYRQCTPDYSHPVFKVSLLCISTLIYDYYTFSHVHFLVPTSRWCFYRLKNWHYYLAGKQLVALLLIATNCLSLVFMTSVPPIRFSCCKLNDSLLLQHMFCAAEFCYVAIGLGILYITKYPDNAVMYKVGWPPSYCAFCIVFLVQQGTVSCFLYVLTHIFKALRST
jgi:hypothetical protein